MSIKKLSKWFLSDTGKKFSYLLAGTLSSGALIGHVVPNTLLLEEYQNMIRLYKNGFSVPLPAKLEERFQKALDLLGVKEANKHLFKPFSVYGFDVFSAGTSYSKYGVIVGLPVNFSYEDTSAVDKNLIKLRDESINWESLEGQLLLKSLILSENAQLYAMAREIKFRETPKLFLDTISSVITITGTYGICNSINRRFNYYARPLGLRIVFYCIVSAFTIGSFLLCKDLSQVYYEDKVDKELVKCNPIFVDGGKEYYSKLLERNVALRKLMGKEGEKMFSALGNEATFLRYKHIPLVQRKLNFEQASVHMKF